MWLFFSPYMFVSFMGNDLNHKSGVNDSWLDPSFPGNNLLPLQPSPDSSLRLSGLAEASLGDLRQHLLFCGEEKAMERSSLCLGKTKLPCFDCNSFLFWALIFKVRCIFFNLLMAQLLHSNNFKAVEFFTMLIYSVLSRRLIKHSLISIFF